MARSKLPYPEESLPTGGPVRKLPVAKLLLDPENPRLQLPPKPTQEKILRQLYEEHRLEELVNSFLANGYFDEEPLVAVPGSRTGTYIVVEGNRRLAALKLITDDALVAKLRVRGLPDGTPAQVDRLLEVPVKVYEERDHVLPYLGFRHITGIKEWDAASKARYIFQLHETSGLELHEIGDRIGDTYNATERLYLGWSLLLQAEDELGVTRDDFKKFYFSYMYDAVRTPEVRQFLGLKPNKYTVSKTNLPQLKELIDWLFGSRSANRDPAVETKAQLKKLSYVVSDKRGTTALRRGMSLDEAYQATIGERDELATWLTSASKSLDKAKGIIHRHTDDDDIEELVDRCDKTIRALAREFGH